MSYGLSLFLDIYGSFLNFNFALQSRATEVLVPLHLNQDIYATFSLNLPYYCKVFLGVQNESSLY